MKPQACKVVSIATFTASLQMAVVTFDIEAIFAAVLLRFNYPMLSVHPELFPEHDLLNQNLVRFIDEFVPCEDFWYQTGTESFMSSDWISS